MAYKRLYLFAETVFLLAEIYIYFTNTNNYVLGLV
jgi:hypothetical protein